MPPSEIPWQRSSFNSSPPPLFRSRRQRPASFRRDGSRRLHNLALNNLRLVASYPGFLHMPASLQFNESAGKRRSTRTRKSGTWIKTTLVTAAWAAVRVKTSYLRAQFLRIKARRGAKKAILAMGRIDAHRGLPHVARWHGVRRPRCRTLRPLRQVQDHPTPAQAAPRSRLRCSRTGSRGESFLADQLSLTPISAMYKADGQLHHGRMS